jgi:crossover junction endodeoxyribonuclease RuvC
MSDQSRTPGCGTKSGEAGLRAEQPPAGEQKNSILPRMFSGLERSDTKISSTLSSMRVLGLDCGSEYTGYGVVEETSERKLVCHVNGAIKLKSGTPMAAKLEKIFTDIAAIIAKHQPEIMAIEDVFYAVNVKSALKLGQVRGVAMLAASTSGLQVAEYSPLSIKSAVVGYGRADKFQVQQMVTRLLNLAAPPEPTDASDALSIAICHIHTAATHNRYAAVSK